MRAETILKNINMISFPVGTSEICEKISQKSPFMPFAEETLDFLSSLSKALMAQGAARQLPDVASFAFWCRKAHLEQMKAQNECLKHAMRVGRGVSLHFAPSNIPVLFAFTMAAGLLAGNSVILRLPQKTSVQESMITEALNALVQGEFQQFQGRLVLCRYGHVKEITDVLSQLCNVRVIWGSDTSVNEIRKSPLPPRSLDLPFPSRGSAAALCARKVCDTRDLRPLIQDFFNDTYLNDQNACSSPQILYWVGTEAQIQVAKQRFWNELHQLLKEKEYFIPAVMAVGKLDCGLYLASQFDHVKLRTFENRIVLAHVPEFKREMWDYTHPGGFFIESSGETLDGLSEILTSHCQTLCTYGIDRKILAEELARQGIFGVDRIVPVGHSLDFSLTWDGMDFIEMMSRKIDVF